VSVAAGLSSAAAGRVIQETTGDGILTIGYPGSG
jgi:hypothetical protein